MSLLSRPAGNKKVPIPVPEEKLKEGTPKEQVFVASQWQLMWWRFRKHHLAILGTSLIAVFYLLAIFCEFLSPYDPNAFERRYTFVPPQAIHFFHEGAWEGPFIYGLERARDPETYLIT
ncbi:MAG: hypothetical protein KDE46_31605 [Caldilineaceae bacterium]|nr:hypothetical protein [Caldilineaceae bacterium]